MNPHHSDCQKALVKLYEYLDNELEAIDREEIAAHLESCRPCLTEFEIERLFQEFVKRKVPRPEARAEFKQHLLARLAEEARSLGEESSPPDK
jgi:mycothiol system anti-sigma-R factor